MSGIKTERCVYGFSKEEGERQSPQSLPLLHVGWGGRTSGSVSRVIHPKYTFKYR